MEGGAGWGQPPNISVDALDFQAWILAPSLVAGTRGTQGKKGLFGLMANEENHPSCQEGMGSGPHCIHHLGAERPMLAHRSPSHSVQEPSTWNGAV